MDPTHFRNAYYKPLLHPRALYSLPTPPCHRHAFHFTSQRRNQ